MADNTIDYRLSVFTDARRSCRSAQHLFKFYFRILSTQSKRETHHALVSLCIAIQEAITAITDIDEPKPDVIWRYSTKTSDAPAACADNDLSIEMTK